MLALPGTGIPPLEWPHQPARTRVRCTQTKAPSRFEGTMRNPDTLQFWLIVAAIAMFILYAKYSTAREQVAQVQRQLESIQGRVQGLAQEQYQQWRSSDIGKLREELGSVADAQARVNLQTWTLEQEGAIRQDAAKRSQAITLGKVTEHLAPYFGAFEFNPKDARFIGTPIDLIVFDGLNDGAVREIAFIEVKTGASKLTAREKMVKQAVLDRRVTWRELRLGSFQEEA
jgi:predicted Holliday junction resolvase-like endonuclease